MRIIGIDPGLSGGAFYYNTETHEFRAHKLKSKDGKIDFIALAAWIDRFRPDHVFVEKIFLTGREGGQSALTIGSNYGRIMAAIETYEYEYTEITPKSWQRALGLKTGSRAIVKQSAQELAVKRFTLLPFLHGKSVKPHDGLTDAACITLYGVQLCETEKTSTKSTQPLAQGTVTSRKKKKISESKKSKSSTKSRSTDKQLRPNSKAKSLKSTSSSKRLKIAGRS